MKVLATFVTYTLTAVLLCITSKGASNINKRPDIFNGNTPEAQPYSMNQLPKTDSVKRAEWVLKIKHHPTTDTLKKEGILKKLRQINEEQFNRMEVKQFILDSFLTSSDEAFPVFGFFEDTLFSIYSKLGSFSASERAKVVTERIDRMKNHHPFSDSTLTVVESESTFDIVNGADIIMSIADNDARWMLSSKKELAELYRNRITQAIIQYQKETSLPKLSKEIGLATCVIILLIILIYLVRRVFAWTALYIQKQEGKMVKGITIRKYTLFDASRLVNFLTTINNLFKWLFVLALVYIALPVIFGFFPWTQFFAQTLFGYVLNPLQKIASELWRYLPNLFTIVVIFLIFSYTIKGIHFLKTEIEKEKLQLSGFYPDWANPTFQILRVLLYAFMFVLIFPYLPGSDSPVFRGVSVFLGFLFTFGSAGSLSNIVAGVVLTYMRLFKLGDRVKIGDVEGDVIEKSILVTRLKTIKNEIVSIPNSTVMSSHTINYSNEAEQGEGLIVHTTVTIGYDVPWKEMNQALLRAADRTSLLLKEPKPFVLQTALDDFYVSYQINAYTKEPNKQALLYSELHQHILDCCNEVRIEILSPHYRAVRDGNASTIPIEYKNRQ